MEELVRQQRSQRQVFIAETFICARGGSRKRAEEVADECARHLIPAEPGTPQPHPRRDSNESESWTKLSLSKGRDRREVLVERRGWEGHAGVAAYTTTRKARLYGL